LPGNARGGSPSFSVDALPYTRACMNIGGLSLGAPFLGSFFFFAWMGNKVRDKAGLAGTFVYLTYMSTA